MSLPFVSIVIPCRNEAAYIDRCLTSIETSDFPADRREVLVVDGMSDDQTRDIVRRHAAADPAVRLIDNPARITPTALNAGIRAAKGEIVVRIDAHAIYPPEYLSKLVRWLGTSGADNVGGVCVTRPGNGSPKAQAIAFGLSHPFGVGNSRFRIGAREPRWVDTVPFGCYRREVFDRIGMFDEELVRNQDDELNARLIRRGGRILLVPEIVSEYFARCAIRMLWRMYYQYGYFKPLVARKVGRVMTVRQVVPALFVASIVAGLMLSGPVEALRLPFAAAIALYVATDLAIAGHAAGRYGGRCGFWLTVVFPVLHVAYGLGFIRGVMDFAVRHRAVTGEVRAMATSR